MSDDEWQRWAVTYAKEVRPIPPVMRRARTDWKRALAGLTVVYLVAAFLVLAGLRELRGAHTIVAVASALFTMLCGPIVIVGLHVAMWGKFGRTGRAPIDLLADLQRRHAGRRRLIRFLPWLTGFAVCGTIAIQVMSMLAAGQLDLPPALATLAICAATIGLVWFAIRRTGKVIDSELRQAAEARRLLAEPDDAS